VARDHNLARALGGTAGAGFGASNRSLECSTFLLRGEDLLGRSQASLRDGALDLELLDHERGEQLQVVVLLFELRVEAFDLLGRVGDDASSTLGRVLAGLPRRLDQIPRGPLGPTIAAQDARSSTGCACCALSFGR
jgi:hypothetical protein